MGERLLVCFYFLFSDDSLYKYADFGVIGLDLWQVKSGTIFDNFLITDDESYAEEFGEETWGATKDPEKEMKDGQAEVESKQREEEEKLRKETEGDDDEEEDNDFEMPDDFDQVS